MAVFLTDEWFAEVDRLTEATGDLNLPPAFQNAKMNLVLTDTPKGEASAHLINGTIKKGSTDAETTVRLDQETLKAIAVKADMNYVMEAFMTGKIRVDGDMSQLMTLQSAKPSAEQTALYKDIYKMTEQAG